jgi:hypothetical protein
MTEQYGLGCAGGKHLVRGVPSERRRAVFPLTKSLLHCATSPMGA